MKKNKNEQIKLKKKHMMESHELMAKIDLQMIPAIHEPLCESTVSLNFTDTIEKC